MKSLWPVLCCAVLAVWLNGCALRRPSAAKAPEEQSALAQERASLQRAVQEADRDLLQRFNRDAAEFYAETADAYFIMGYEYYNLCKEMSQKGDKPKADEYARRAQIYYNFYRDLQANAKRRREALGNPEGAAPQPAASSPSLAGVVGGEFLIPPEAPSAPPPMTIQSPPEAKRPPAP